MSLQLREDCTYALLVPTSMGVRITPVNRQPVYSSDTFMMHVTSGGIARKINNLCTSCLLHAFAKSKSLVDDRMIRVVLENEFLG
jgi:hypothetical protein